MNFPCDMPDWAMGVNCAITVCDANADIIYMNQASREVNGDGTDSLIGQNLMPCHNERSCGIISRLLAQGGLNAYTIQKGDVRKLIYQTAWHRDDGSVGGIVEFSMPLPEEMPHYIRKPKPQQ